MKRVLVIGGGIAGLSLAYAAAHRGDCTLIERDDRLGGKILTVHDQPFTLEAGPDSFLTTKPAAVELCEELGLSEQLIDTRPENNHTYVVRRRTLHALPAGLTSFIPTRWGPFIRSGLISPLGMLRMAIEPFVPPVCGRVPTGARAGVQPSTTCGGAAADPSMAEFFTRRLGSEAYHWLVEPLLAGIYAGRGNALGMRATFPRFLELEAAHGSLVRAAWSTRQCAPPPTDARGMFQTLRGGLSTLVDALRRKVEPQVKIRTGIHARSVKMTSGGVQVALSDGSTWDGDHVAICIPADEAATLMQPLDEVLARLLAGMTWSSTATISLALRGDELRHPMGGYGFVVPRAEGRSTIACTWTSQKWPHRAPSDWILLRSYLGGSGRDALLELPDDVLVEEAVADLTTILGCPIAPRRTWIHRWKRGLPQYVPGHLRWLEDVERRLSLLDGRVQLVGGSYRGVGIPDCIADGRRAAAKL